MPAANGTQVSVANAEDDSANVRMRFAALLNGYSRLRDQNAVAQSDAVKPFSSLLADFRKVRKRWGKSQAKTADGFNLFDVIQLTGKELCHSMVLAWLLDQDISWGTHAQGSACFRLFLEKTRLPLEYAAMDYWVRREVQGDDSRVDIEIASRNGFLIHIENKIWSVEGEDQTDREFCDLKRRARDLGVGERFHGFFLTLKGQKASNQQFAAIRWSKIADIAEQFAVQVPPDVKLFCRHYAKALRRFVVEEPEPKGER